MSSNRKTQRPQPANDDLPACFDSPDQLWGRRFGRPLLDAGLPFEERVAMAWEHIKTTRFVADEHERLQEVLVEMITKESSHEKSNGEVLMQLSRYNEQTRATGADSDEAINLNERQAAKFLGIGARTLWQLRRDGSVPYVRFGKTVRYPKPLLMKWLLERAQSECAVVAEGRLDKAVATAPDPTVGSGNVVRAEA